MDGRCIKRNVFYYIKFDVEFTVFWHIIHVVQGELPSSEQKTHACFAAMKMEVAGVSKALTCMHLADDDDNDDSCYKNHETSKHYIQNMDCL